VEPKRELWGLFRRRQCLVPTWRGSLLFLLILLAIGLSTVRKLHSFLAVNDPVSDGVMVLEGWAPDYVLSQGVAQFRSNHFEKIFVTGGPLLWGEPLSEYRTYAERGAAVLLKWGLTTNEVQAVPAPDVRQDRTYTAALTLKGWWAQHGFAPAKIQLVSAGPHGRRSRLLYQKALGSSVRIGITSIQDQDYDPRAWWRSSAGVRGVIDESVAYLYAKLLFRPHSD
jgi:uncharacterized SAM-binding protein YcdF (DUF218 family)